MASDHPANRSGAGACGRAVQCRGLYRHAAARRRRAGRAAKLRHLDADGFHDRAGARLAAVGRADRPPGSRTYRARCPSGLRRRLGRPARDERRTRDHGTRDDRAQTPPLRSGRRTARAPGIGRERCLSIPEVPTRTRHRPSPCEGSTSASPTLPASASHRRHSAGTSRRRVRVRRRVPLEALGDPGPAAPGRRRRRWAARPAVGLRIPRLANPANLL